jgi:hypothetical protein
MIPFAAAFLLTAPAAVLQSPPRTTLGAPLPADVAPYPDVGQVVNLPAAPLRPISCPRCGDADSAPPVPFLGSRYSFYSPRTPCASFSYYGPGYTAPQFFNPRYPSPGPYYYSPAYPFAPTYYSYYYTPGFFRY